jgi:DNA polymerase-3 subunit delta'
LAIGFGSIIGQHKAAGFLSALLRKGTIPNALLFTGPEGVGKRDAAYAFAMAANCVQTGSREPFEEHVCRTASGQGVFPSEPCGRCRSCGKFESGNHPDLLRVDPDGQFTKIAQIRELRQALSMKPFEARLRVVIVGQAHTMKAEASNALLKVLEEPPNRTLLILVAMQTTDLLPTIVSRCRQIRFRPVPVGTLTEELVRKHAMGEYEARILASLAKGSLAKALEMRNTDRVARRNWMVREASGLEDNPPGIVMAFAEKLANKKDDAVDALEILKTWLRDLIVSKYSPAKILNADFAERIENASEGCAQTELLDRIKAVERAQRLIDSNANPRLVLENLFLGTRKK